ncbi:HNH endonuclease domain protein [Acinetobacter radioresistens WC-A-157]|uniref:HNH endonuclease n=1 Tax=Acinetobacter radioresistens TaxID=40216 RepID=UPI000277C4B5|nr:HNH endonuclease [Acinetobacter radioresistens]EJO33955.1 HNH endonuclease domain protein [Acinetobacter radioresistens WC-A-157]
MYKWLIPVDPDVYEIDRAFLELPYIYWAKNNYDYQIGDIIYLYVSEPIGKIKYSFKVINYAENSELPERDKDYWLDKEALSSYTGTYFIIEPIKVVNRKTLSRKYLIEQNLISAKDTLQSHKTTKPVQGKSAHNVNAHQILFNFIEEEFLEIKQPDYPDEANLESPRFTEGQKIKITVNGYERCPKARAECIAIYGNRCYVCGISFQHMYGSFAKDFIHVHHIKPLYTIGEEYEVDPKEDLRPVCPNCHAMLHKTENGFPMTIKKLKLLYSASLKDPLRQIFED